MIIGTIQELGEIITNEMKNNIPLYDLKHIMQSYSGLDWVTHINFDSNMYSKSTVFINDIIEIAVISWDTKQSSLIHDHPDNGCLLKVMFGEITENKYYFDKTEEIQKLVYINSEIHLINSISYISGKDIVHNISTENRAITLHIYSPSNYIQNFFTDC